ncbi:MAG: YicC/YloC family endoribonuclease [Luteolibacter sp.]
MHSMTGFGFGSAAGDDFRITIEAASVNRKQAEVVIQSPRELSSLEETLRKQVMERVSRGRVQVAITLERTGDGSGRFQVDGALARAFSEAIQELRAATGESITLDAGDFLRQPGIVIAAGGEINLEAASAVAQTALREALDQLTTMRAREGGDLRNDFLRRLGTLRELTNRIESQAVDRPARQRELLIKRLAESGLELDPADEKVSREIALFADRCCISEEITRLDSHFAKFTEYLDAESSCGRALDFLCQEIHREFNTIGSKANDAAVAHLVVEAKTELEKIREQVQNAE